jgi:hypothetical protein
VWSSAGIRVGARASFSPLILARHDQNGGGVGGLKHTAPHTHPTNTRRREIGFFFTDARIDLLFRRRNSQQP